MIPKWIYEALPYSYLALGATLMVTSHSRLMVLAGLALYIAGALCWIVRARYRQRHGRRYPAQEYRDLPKPRVLPIDNYTKTRRLPKALYEALPFSYLLAGLLSYQLFLPLQPSYLSMAASVLFFSAGLSSWILRGHYRGYHQSHSPVLND